MSSRRQRSIPLGGRYRQVSMYHKAPEADHYLKWPRSANVRIFWYRPAEGAVVLRTSCIHRGCTWSCWLWNGGHLILASVWCWLNAFCCRQLLAVTFAIYAIPGCKVHGANMGPIWGRQTQVGPLLAPWTLLSGILIYDYPTFHGFRIIM